MSHLGNPPRVQVGKEPRHRTYHENTNWNQENGTAKEEDATDSIAATTTTTYAPITIQAEKEDGTDSTATTKNNCSHLSGWFRMGRMHHGGTSRNNNTT